MTTLEILLKLRQANRLTQEEIADTINVHRQRYMAIENGLPIRIKEAISLADFYQIDLDQLAGRKPITSFLRKVYTLKYIKEFCLN